MQFSSWKRGSWQSPRLTNLDVIALISTLAVQASIRAWDYTTGESEPSLSLVEEAFTLQVWGWILFTLAGSLFIGMLFKVHKIVWAAHSLLGCVYFVLLVGITISILANNPPPWDGVRFGGLLLTPMVLHWVFAIRTGPTPLCVSEARPVETVVKEDG